MVSATVPNWFRPVFLALSAVLLLGWFSPEISDTDFWWHLKTGQYIFENHSLPAPDPFAFTTAGSRPAYSGEERTRVFNLTHEWLSQALFYAIYRVAGLGGIVVFRAAVLAVFCGIVGVVAYRRCGGFYRAVAAAFGTAGVAAGFALDRPFVITFLLLAVTIAILEFDRYRWMLPPILLVWANCHGGYFLGWVALGAYSAEAALLRKGAGGRVLWVVSALAIAISGLNPNGYRIAWILAAYRNSYLTSRLLEWAPPALWPPRWYSLLLFAAAAVLLWARRRVRPVDWMLFAAFTAAALTASRNVILIGLLSPLLMVSYLPTWKRPVPRLLQYGAAALAATGMAAGIARGSFFQLRANEWKWPAGAADFLLAHHITQPMFNTYEHGGYLIWRLWPQERVFIDGRSLSESVFLDYARILYNHDESGGKDAQALLDQYGVQVIVMNGFEYNTGNVYLLAPALADPQQSAWKLVFNDPSALVFMRHPPPGVEALPPLGVFEHLEAECDLHIQREPQYSRCARSLGQVFLKIGDGARARRWLGVYLGLPHHPDAQAEQAFQQLLNRQ
jgi:hypothetical protein